MSSRWVRKFSNALVLLKTRYSAALLKNSSEETTISHIYLDQPYHALDILTGQLQIMKDPCTISLINLPRGHSRPDGLLTKMPISKIG